MKFGYAGNIEPSIYQICTHIQNQYGDYDLCQYFTGKGITHHLICYNCARNLDNFEKFLVEVSKEDFYQIFNSIDSIFDIEMAVGQPEILIEDRMSYELEEINWSIDLKTKNILKIIESEANNEILVLISDKRYERLSFTNCQFLLLNYSTGVTEKILEIDDNFNDKLSGINWLKPLELLFSKDDNIVVIANTHGSHLYVIDTSNENIMHELNRGGYHVDVSSFPILLFHHGDDLHLVFGSDWNRVDIMNLGSGKILSERDDLENFDYFHSSLSISPKKKWIISNGWVWAPYGVPIYWNLDEWLQNPAIPELSSRSNYIGDRTDWDYSITWINDSIFAIIGYANLENISQAVSIIDIESLKVLSWFPGPIGDIYYESKLHALIEFIDNEVKIWDLRTGTRIGLIDRIKPLVYSDMNVIALKDNELVRLILKSEDR